MRKLIFILSALILSLSVCAQEIEVSGTRKAVRTSGDVGALLLPVAGVTAVLLQKDWQGLKQGVFSGVTTLGVTYALKYIVKKERPDRSDNHSFPSMHTSTSFAAAAFIQRRYGWKWGIIYICRMDSCLRKETRLVGCSCRSSNRSRKFLHLHPPVCQEAQPDNQPCCRRRTLRVLCIHELLKETAAESTAILIKNPLLKNSREDLLYYYNQTQKHT